MSNSNFDKLRGKENYFDFAKTPNDELFKTFIPNSDYDPLFSQIFELAGYKQTDITTRTVFIGHHAKNSLKLMAHHLIKVIFNVKRGLKNEDVNIQDKIPFIEHFLGEFGNLKNGNFYDQITYLSSPEETEKARIAFQVAFDYVKSGEYSADLFQGIIDLLNVLTNSLKLAKTGEFMSVDLVDLVEMAIFDTDGALVKMMADHSYTHQVNCLPVWLEILNTSPYLLWLKVNETGVVRAFNIQEAIGVYRIKFDSDEFDSADLRLKRRTIFNELNVAFGTSDTVVPENKPKKFNKATEYFKKKHKYAKKRNNQNGGGQAQQKAVKAA